MPFVRVDSDPAARQPRGRVRLDRRHPLAPYLGAAYLFNGDNPLDLVRDGSGFTPSGTIGWSGSPYGLSIQGDGSTGYLSRTVSGLNAIRPHLLLCVFTGGTSGTDPVYYALGSAATSSGAYVLLRAMSGSVNASMRSKDSSTVIQTATGPVIGDGLYAAAFIARSLYAANNVLIVNGVQYTVSGSDLESSLTSALAYESIGALRRGTVTNYSSGRVFFVGRGSSDLSLDVISAATEWTKNPWRIFVPKRQILYFEVRTGVNPLIRTRQPLIRQPSYGTRIDTTNPITRDLRLLTIPGVTPQEQRLGVAPVSGASYLVTTDAAGKALRGDGSTNVFRYPRAAYPTAGDISVFAVIRPNSLASNSGILAKNGTNITVNFLVEGSSAKLAQYRYYNLSDRYHTSSALQVPTTGLSAVGFSQLAAGNALPRFFLNGAFETGSDAGGSLAAAVPEPTDVDVGIGCYSATGGKFNGWIYLVALWGRLLSDAEMLSLYRNPWQLFMASPRVMYFDAGSLIARRNRLALLG